jgi:hypothetical protein
MYISLSNILHFIFSQLLTLLVFFFEEPLLRLGVQHLPTMAEALGSILSNWRGKEMNHYVLTMLLECQDVP